MSIKIVLNDITKLEVDAVVNTAKIAVQTCKQKEKQHDSCPKIIFCCFGREDYQIYQEILETDS